VGPGAVVPNTVISLKRYKVDVEAIAAKLGAGAGAADTVSFHFTFVVSVRSGGTVDISASTVIAAPIITGAAFVGATLVPSSTGANNLTLTFAIAAGLTVQSFINCDMKFTELLGT